MMSNKNKSRSYTCDTRSEEVKITEYFEKGMIRL